MDDQTRLMALAGEVDSLDDAWRVFGQTLGESADGRSPVERAKDAFRRLRPQLKVHLCGDPRITTFLTDPRADTWMAIAMVVTGKLADVRFAGVDYVALAVLVARLGLQQLCAAP